MAKKTGQKTSPKTHRLDDAIHFRPGREIGRLIGELSETWQSSRGETAKRLCALALYGLDINFAETAGALLSCLPESSAFEDACLRIHARLVDDAEERNSQRRAPATKVEQLEIARATVNPYQFVSDMEDEVKTKQIQISLIRTD